MAPKLTQLSWRYQTALRKYLGQGPRASLQPAQGLGRRAMALGLETLGLARIHEQALIRLVLPSHSPGTRAAMVRRSGIFFAEVITPIEKTHRTARDANRRLHHMLEALSRRSTDLDDSNRQLKQEVAQRKTVEESLRNSQRHYSDLLERSQRLQEQLRLLSRQLLAAQEEERKKISRELHDEIAQTLASINVRLAGLKTEATFGTKGLQKRISSTQRMVERSVDIVHRFARDLRPTVLDDLGLIPALHSHLKDFGRRTGIRIHFTAFTLGRIKGLDNAGRTVLYRVAQEALLNVVKHARASEVDVTVRKLPKAIRMEITDHGHGFEVHRVLFAKRHKRLGVLGMRERVEMVGGRFSIESAPGKTTTIRAEVPFATRNGA